MGMRIVVPPVGWSCSGTISEWYKDDGDWVNVGAPLFTLQMGVSTHPITALESGFLRLPTKKRAIGSVVQRGDLLGLIVAPGEAAEWVARTSPPPPARGRLNPSVDERLLHLVRANKPQRRRISPRARRAALDAGVRWEQLRGSGLDGRIIAQDVEAAARVRSAKTATSGVLPQISATATLPLSNGADPPAIQRTVDDVLRRVLQILQRRSVPHDSISFGVPQADGIRFTSFAGSDEWTAETLGSWRTQARDRMPAAQASWLLLDVAGIGLESLLMPIPAGCSGMLVIGRDAAKLRVSLFANTQHLNVAEALAILRELIPN